MGVSGRECFSAGGRQRLKKLWSSAEFLATPKRKERRPTRSRGFAPPSRLLTPSSPATRWRFCLPCKWRKRRVLRRLPVAPSGTAETAWLAVLAARRPAISAVVSVAEVRSPRVYEVFMPGALSAYKCVSFCAARACRGLYLAVLRRTLRPRNLSFAENCLHCFV